jgi:RNA polymerase sigma factor (sigma-70 family)
MATDAARRQRFTELYDVHHPKVVAYVRRRVDGDAVADAVADTFLAAWKNLDRLSGDPRLWLYGLARGVVSHHRRRLGRIARLNERVVQLDPGSRSADPAVTAGWQDAFSAAFGQLTEVDREVLRVVAWEGLTTAEGAVVLGCSETAFKVRLHRARRRLRRLLDAADEPEPASLPERRPVADRPRRSPMTQSNRSARPAVTVGVQEIPEEPA